MAQVHAPNAQLLESRNANVEADTELVEFHIPGSHEVHGHVFPLGLEYKGSSLESALKHFEKLGKNGVLDSLLSKHGAVLFRGVPIHTPEHFKAFVDSFSLPKEHLEVGLSGARTVVTGHVKTANEQPSHVRAYHHNEYGRSASFPAILFFYSHIVPTSGGQTPLLSSLELYDRLKIDLPEFLEELTTKGVIGRQFYPAKSDPVAKTIGWNWQDSFGVEFGEGDDLQVQHQKVEAELKKTLKATADWQPDGSLHVLQHLPAIRRLKSTGEPTFFNGIGGIYGRARDLGTLDPPHRGPNGNYNLPTTYGDNTIIPYKYLDRLLEIANEIGLYIPWQAGDVAFINNYTAQHGRSPWVGERSLLVSLWESNDALVEI